jgi:hypothetical protein
LLIVPQLYCGTISKINNHAGWRKTMEVKIYRDVPLLPDVLIGRINEEGKVFDVESGEEEYIGYIDYKEGEVYDPDEDLMGWIENDGTIIGQYEDEKEEIGYVTDDGEVYGYDDEGQELYLGKVTPMQDATEGAAAMLLFYDIFDEQEEE